MKHDLLCFGGIVKNSEPPIMCPWWNRQTQQTFVKQERHNGNIMNGCGLIR